jgi:hypothetical protein
LKKIKDRKRPSCSWISRINAIKMAFLLKAVYRSNAKPTKFSMFFFTEITKNSYGSIKDPK